MKPNLDRCTKMLRDMVATDTRQPEGRERVLTDYIEDIFSEFDVEKVRIDHSENRSSLVIKLKGSSDGGGIGFFSHLDTVAFGDEALWTYDPLSATIENGLMYGRGTADMKGGAVSMIEMALCVLESGTLPPKPVYLCFTADEEAGGMGARSLLELPWMQEIEAGVFCEPSDERIGICEKGALWLRVDVQGIQAHGSNPAIAINALDKAIEFYQKFISTIDFETTDSLLGKASVSLTQLHGGFMTNVIPGEAWLELDIRLLPGQLSQGFSDWVYETFEALQQQDERLQFKLSVLSRHDANSTPAEHPFVRCVQQVCDMNHHDSSLRGLLFFTDAGRITPTFQLPYVIWGPGDDKQAHQIDERIELVSVHRMANLYLDLVMSE